MNEWSAAAVWDRAHVTPAAAAAAIAISAAIVAARHPMAQSTQVIGK